MKIVKLDFGEILKLKKYIKKYYILIILNILLATMSSLVSSAPIALIKRLFDKGISGKSEKDILYAAGAMIMLAAIGAILMYWNTIFSTVISSSIYKDIVTDIYNKIQWNIFLGKNRRYDDTYYDRSQQYKFNYIRSF